MKKLLLLCLPLALLYACSGDEAHKTELIYDKAQPGLHISAVRDTFNKYKGTYYIKATIKNDTKDKAENFLVSVKYIDQVGDIVAESSNGAGKVIAAGDSLLIENEHDFKLNKDVPYKVKIDVKSMF